MKSHGIKSDTRNEKNAFGISNDTVAIDCYWTRGYIWRDQCGILCIVDSVVWYGSYLFWCDDLV